MTTATIRNDFHNTEARIRLDADGMAELTQQTVRRIRRKLCGMADCHCGGSLSQRGPQEVRIEDQANGGVIVRKE